MISDPKIDKKQKSPILPIPPAPPSKHRSLFSPEKTIVPTKESSHSIQRLKQKSKPSPGISKSQELFTSGTNSLPTTTDLTLNKQKLSNSTTSGPSQKHRGSSNLEIGVDHEVKPQQQQINNHSRRFLSNFGSQEMQGGSGNRISDMTQHSKDNFMNNKNINANSLNEMKQPMDSVKFSDGSDSAMSMNNQRHKQQHSSSSNGLDSSITHDYSTVDPSLFIKSDLPDDILSGDMPTDLMFIKPEPSVNDILSFAETPIKTENPSKVDLNNLKTERFSPLKSAQSISALLQQPLAPMPSLLQNISNYEQQPQQQPFSKESNNFMQSHQTLPEPSLLSTVDMSALAPSNCISDINLSGTATTSISTDNAVPTVLDSKKSEHRSKSEKKKKKDKHKHKDKDKSKEKHKNKHKDKDKDREKHHREKSDREKDNKTEKSSGSSSYPLSGISGIKITIPKGKLNLSTEMGGTSSAAFGNSLKIKIPKERLKGSDVSSQPVITTQTSSVTPQTSLKIKIRTDTLPRGPGASSQTSSQQESSRKRERADFTDGSSTGAPPAKKQSQQSQLQQQRPNENQNGRHNSHSSGSSSKVC